MGEVVGAVADARLRQHPVHVVEQDVRVGDAAHLEVHVRLVHPPPHVHPGVLLDLEMDDGVRAAAPRLAVEGMALSARLLRVDVHPNNRVLGDDVHVRVREEAEAVRVHGLRLDAALEERQYVLLGVARAARDRRAAALLLYLPLEGVHHGTEGRRILDDLHGCGLHPVHHLLKRLLDQGLLRRHRHRQLGSWRRAGRNDDVNRSIACRDSQGLPGRGSLRDGDGRHRQSRSRCA